MQFIKLIPNISRCYAANIFRKRTIHKSRLYCNIQNIPKKNKKKRERINGEKKIKLFRNSKWQKLVPYYAISCFWLDIHYFFLTYCRSGYRILVSYMGNFVVKVDFVLLLHYFIQVIEMCTYIF